MMYLVELAKSTESDTSSGHLHATQNSLVVNMHFTTEPFVHSEIIPFPDSEQLSISSPLSTDNTGPIVGGVAAVVAVLLVCLTVALITYLVLRHKRGRQMYVSV